MLYLTLYFAALFGIALPVYNRFFTEGPSLYDPAGLWFSFFFATLVLGLTFLARLSFDKKSLHSLGFRVGFDTLFYLAAAVLLAFVLQGSVFVLGRFGGLIEVTGFNQTLFSGYSLGLSLLIAGGTLAASALLEETIFRGYILQNLLLFNKTALAVALSSLLFSSLHFFNPHISPLGLVNLFLAGVLLAMAYLVTRSLWFPIALHAAWNFFEGPFFGFPISGIASPGLMQTRLGGSPLWMGGDFGPEGGLIDIAVVVVGIGLLYAYGVLRGLWGQRTLETP